MSTRQEPTSVPPAPHSPDGPCMLPAGPPFSSPEKKSLSQRDRRVNDYLMHPSPCRQCQEKPLLWPISCRSHPRHCEEAAPESPIKNSILRSRPTKQSHRPIAVRQHGKSLIIVHIVSHHSKKPGPGQSPERPGPHSPLSRPPQHRLRCWTLASHAPDAWAGRPCYGSECRNSLAFVSTERVVRGRFVDPSLLFFEERGPRAEGAIDVRESPERCPVFFVEIEYV